MRFRFLAAMICLVALAGADVLAVEQGNFQIVKTDDGNVWRMDTRTGEIVMCRAESGRMVCASSGEDIAPSSTTPEDLEAARARVARDEEAARSARVQQMLGVFERLIEVVQTQQQASGSGSGTR